VAIPVTTNTINTIDVLNGVVSGFILISLVPVTFAIGLRFYLGTYQGPANGEVLLLSVLPIFAAIGAFFLFHRYPSKIFPGDSGALAMGGAYGALAIIGGVEFVAMIAILPAILNSFFFLSSVRKLVEHREIESNPTVALPDTRILSNTDPKAPVTLMRLIVAFAPLREDEIASDIFKVSAFCSVLAIITALLTWGFAIG
jgi:UDP-N-acetylglucosamine--dolichyl-phosphate N-acetylglucosaminephosphotransferase